MGFFLNLVEDGTQIMADSEAASETTICFMSYYDG